LPLHAFCKQTSTHAPHSSNAGHAYQEELKELLQYVKPQHFLPVHGEYAFLTEHARLAHEEAGVQHCNVSGQKACREGLPHYSIQVEEECI
jgi:mRNA degradation ribonuclease J1/J2